MTTIAWDGRALAADRLATSSTGFKRETRKLYRLRNGSIFAGCGDWTDTQVVAAWLDGPKRKGRPTLDQPEGCNGLLWVAKEKRLYTVEGAGLVLFRVLEPFFASGSGRAFAMGAMSVGASAEQSVRAAMRFDAWTGIGVDVLSL